MEDSIESTSSAVQTGCLKTGLMNEPFLSEDTKLVIDPETVKESPEILPENPEAGYTAEEIKASWQEELEIFKEERKPYLLY